MNLSRYYRKRSQSSHKGDFGYVLVVGGSSVYSGSPALNALASLRAGADWVTITGPRRAMDIAATFLPDLITYPLSGELGEKHVGTIRSLLKKHDSLVIGGGLKRASRVHRAVRMIIASCALPMVIDAEAIRAIAMRPALLTGKRCILTPHAGEFKALTGKDLPIELRKRQAMVKRFAKKLNAVLLVKGAVDVISDGKRIAVNKSGTPFMTKAGTGDTLAGICGALLARDIEPWHAAYAAAYINGRAGEMAAQKFGEGLLASDLTENIPKVIQG